MTMRDNALERLKLINSQSAGDSFTLETDDDEEQSLVDPIVSLLNGGNKTPEKPASSSENWLTPQVLEEIRKNPSILDHIPSLLSGVSAQKIFQLGMEIGKGNNETAPVVHDNVIEVKNLMKRFGQVYALTDVNFSVKPGTVFSILGPNGAGKTTTVNVLSTILKPDGGKVTVAGYDVETEPEKVRENISVTGQYAALDDMLTARENLILFARLQGISPIDASNRAHELISDFRIEKIADRPVSTYSGGQRRRADLACGLVTQPKVLFLDEPTTGLDPSSRCDIWEAVENLKAQGVAIVLTTQYLEEADQLADEIIVIDRGTVIAEGTVNSLKRQAGNSYCEVELSESIQLDEALKAIKKALSLKPIVEGRKLTTPAPNGSHTLVALLNCLHERNIEIADASLRLPSLDEVFFTLTAADRPGGLERR